MDWIENNVESINISEKEIILKNQVRLSFLNKVQQEEVNVLEETELENIQIDHLNTEEKQAIRLLLEKNKK